MGPTSMTDKVSSPVTLVIFTCEGREHLLYNTFNSFKSSCNYPFFRTVLAIDGKINPEVIDHIQPDVVIQSPVRKGYVNNIVQALPAIDSEYFFWLEDDWKFHENIDVAHYLNIINEHPNWAEIFFSKFGPLEPDFKVNPLGDHLYKTTFGFSANPGICNTRHIRSAFELLIKSPKGDKLGEDGFENFLSKQFEKEGIVCAIIDPVDHETISHEGYLESSSRKWHMTNSLEQKDLKHQMAITQPQLWRRIMMIFKLFTTFFRLAFKQLVNDEVYEFCFRIISSLKTFKKRA
ncbi:MAG TPA: hypothetical protein VIM89_17245 [Mucilaginibacter sp.]